MSVAGAPHGSWRILRALFAAALLAQAGVAHAGGRIHYGDPLQAALPSTPVSLDPLSGAPAEVELGALIFDSVSDAALTVEPLPGPRARLTLRPAMQFHDGSPVRAADVAASLTRALADPRGWVLGPVRAARAVGAELVELDLWRPSPDLTALLAGVPVTPGGLRPGRIGSGAFKVERFDGASLRLAPSVRHHRGRPYLGALTLRAFASRTDEAASLEVGSLAAAQSAGPADRPAAARVELDGPVAAIELIAVGGSVTDEQRRGLSLAIDRERLRRQAVHAPSRPLALPYDLERARALLPSHGRAAAMALLVNRSRLADREVADRILADLTRAGVELTVDAVDAAVYQQRLAAGRFDVALALALPPGGDTSLAELAALAVVNPAAARAALARAPASTSGAVRWEGARVIPLYQVGRRIHLIAALRGVTLDAAGRPSWADAYLRGAR